MSKFGVLVDFTNEQEEEEFDDLSKCWVFGFRIFLFSYVNCVLTS